MTRKHRIWFPGAKFHITSRGIRKSALFFDDADRKQYLLLLKETKKTSPFYLHSYCLMTTHIHLQIETIQIPTSQLIKNIHTVYAKYFNKKYSFTGHVFEDRYGAQLIETAEYELDVSKYIHLNPVKAGIVEKPEYYPWSSFRGYLPKQINVPLLHSSQLLSYFPTPQRENYYKYINSPYVPLQNDTPLYTEYYQELLKQR
ncbi:transposase [Fredinandcohnia sp. 179-A 10B2 NHS]|uniref:transposase n=1 Tax=Fredinandcohnia sp. 179-A 10B2 NHS TaxID=3235176 RepID=UPI0039A2E912